MADNRLRLKHVPTGDTFLLAAWYADRGWFSRPVTDGEKIAFVDRFDAWLDGHQDDDAFNDGANYVLEYEAGQPPTEPPAAD